MSSSPADEPGLIAAAPARTSAGVFGIARTTAASRPPPTRWPCRDAGGDRQDARGPSSPTARAASATSPGLTASTAPAAGTGASTMSTPGERPRAPAGAPARPPRPRARRRRARPRQTAEERLAHAPAADDQQRALVRLCGHPAADTHAVGTSARCAAERRRDGALDRKRVLELQADLPPDRHPRRGCRRAAGW